MTEQKKIVHPAQYTPAIVDKMLERLQGVRGLLVDPFAGPGMQLHRFCGPGRRVVGIELEQPWVDAGGLVTSGLVQQGDSTKMRGIRRNSVAAFFLSPSYGNRFADSHNARERCSKCKATGFSVLPNDELPDGLPCSFCNGEGRRHHTRRGYTHDIRAMTGKADYTLDDNNTGKMHFGTAQYRLVHLGVYRCMFEKAKPGCIALVNVSDFYRGDELMRGVLWHLRTMLDCGWEWTNSFPIPTPRMRYGSNSEKRVKREWILEFEKTA